MDRLRYLLGILTLVAMVAGGWFLYRQLSAADAAHQFGIQVTFLDVRGLKPGADVKFRGIQVGSVRGIDVVDEGAAAVVDLSIEPGKAGLIRNNSRFWVVTPRFHGLNSGLSGLDTLVRDAYVAFSTPTPKGEPMPPGSGLRGEEAPIAAKEAITLPPVGRGDLLLRILLPENHGVAVGARIMFRGMPTGEVRSIALAPSGTHVEVQARILARYRSTVTDASQFWVAKPDLDLRFSFSSPVALNEVGALLSPFIAYYTPPETGVPVGDNYPVAAQLSRPDIDITPVPARALRKKPTMEQSGPEGPFTLVRIVYEAVDVDYMSPDDKLRRESTGMLYVDGKGRALVVTTRSSCDADYFYRETFGEKADIKNERIAVQLPGSQVLRATRIWTQPSGMDLAILEVQGLPRKYPTTRLSALVFRPRDEIAKESLQLRSTGELGVANPAIPLDLKTAALKDVRGSVICIGDQAAALLGQASGTVETPVLISLIAIPDSLRPGE